MNSSFTFNPRAAWAALALPILSVVAQSSGFGAVTYSESSDDALIERFTRGLPQGFFNPDTQPGNPVPVQHFYSEWEPASGVLISVPLNGLFHYPELLKFVLDFLEATLPHTSVGILYNREEEIHLGRFVSRIERDTSLGDYASRIDFIESTVHGFWIRDHGPQFARSEQGDLLVIDNVYRVLDTLKSSNTTSPAAASELSRKRYQDDLTPLFVARYLRSKRDIEARIIKPPLHMHGGDFSTDGRGNIFTSEHTITENGSDLAWIDETFKRYYGASRIHVLNPPDGNTAKHLDLFFKVVSDDVYFVSKPPSKSMLDSSHDRLLSRQITQTLENNLSYIKRTIGEAKVVELPMPSLLVKSRSERLQNLRNELLAVVSKRARVDWDRILSLDPSSPEIDAAQDAVALEMLVSTDVEIDLKNESQLEIASKHYLGIGIEEFLDTYVNPETVYRSYTNSLIVENTTGETLILLPRFSPQEGESVEVYAAMEKSVGKAY